MSIPAEPEQLQVESTVRFDPLLELAGMGCDEIRRDRSIKEVGLVRREADPPKEMPVHERPIAPRVDRAHRVIFVKVISCHPLEREITRCTRRGEMAVNRDRG